MRTIALTTIAMVAFAANSVLARLAFATAGAEPLSYTGIPIAGAGGILFIGEAPNLRLMLAGIAIIGGVALALVTAGRRRGT